VARNAYKRAILERPARHRGLPGDAGNRLRGQRVLKAVRCWPGRRNLHRDSTKISLAHGRSGTPNRGTPHGPNPKGGGVGRGKNDSNVGQRDQYNLLDGRDRVLSMRASLWGLIPGKTVQVNRVEKRWVRGQGRKEWGDRRKREVLVAFK